MIKMKFPKIKRAEAFGIPDEGCHFFYSPSDIKEERRSRAKLARTLAKQLDEFCGCNEKDFYGNYTDCEPCSVKVELLKQAEADMK